MERRMDQVHLEAFDTNTIQVLHKELKVRILQDLSFVTSHNKRYLLSIFERYEIVALSKRQLNKLPDDFKLLQSEQLL